MSQLMNIAKYKVIINVLGVFDMLKVTLYIFIYSLAVYGVLSLAISVFDSIRQRIGNENSRVRLILIIKNQENTIEGIIRNIFRGDFLRRVMSGGKLIVLDMDSTDKTFDILIKLKDDYGCFHVLKGNEKENIFTNFD
jgi:hypothetical protein